MSLWLNLKRNKTYADIYKDGKYICTIRVDEQNRGSTSIVALDADKSVSFKIMKEKQDDFVDESFFNKEIFNK